MAQKGIEASAGKGPQPSNPARVERSWSLFPIDAARTGVAVANALRQAGLANVTFSIENHVPLEIAVALQGMRHEEAADILAHPLSVPAKVEAESSNDYQTWHRTTSYVGERLVGTLTTNYGESQEEHDARMAQRREELVLEAVSRVRVLKKQAEAQGQPATFYDPHDPISDNERKAMELDRQRAYLEAQASPLRSERTRLATQLERVERDLGPLERRLRDIQSQRSQIPPTIYPLEGQEQS